MPQNRTSLKNRALAALGDAQQIVRQTNLNTVADAKQVLSHVGIALRCVEEIEAAFPLSTDLLLLRDDALALTIRATRRLEPWSALGQVGTYRPCI